MHTQTYTQSVLRSAFRGVLPPEPSAPSASQISDSSRGSNVSVEFSTIDGFQVTAQLGISVQLDDCAFTRQLKIAVPLSMGTWIYVFTFLCLHFNWVQRMQRVQACGSFQPLLILINSRLPVQQLPNSFIFLLLIPITKPFL